MIQNFWRAKPRYNGWRASNNYVSERQITALAALLVRSTLLRVHCCFYEELSLSHSNASATSTNEKSEKRELGQFLTMDMS